MDDLYIHNIDLLNHHGNNDGAVAVHHLVVNGGPIENIKNDNRVSATAPSYVEGQFEIPTKTTSIATFLNGNIKYIGGNEYPTKDVYDTYERYRNGNRDKYDFIKDISVER